MNDLARDLASTARLPLPTRAGALSFWLRSRAFILLRALRDLGDRSHRRWPRGHALAEAAVLAESRTPLWRDGRGDEFALVAGKVHNLRVALRAFDGVVVPAGATLSFWRQLGRPTALRGFVRGRELRGGCIVPVVAGGLCQLSNALADVAARAGIAFVERHAHSARVGDDGAIDATVFWNYVDLRLRAAHAWRLEVQLGADALVVRVRADMPVRAAPDDDGGASLRSRAVRPLRGCLTCAEAACFRHEPSLRAAHAREAWLLDAWTPEFAAHLATRTGADDVDRHAPPTGAQWRQPWRSQPRNWVGARALRAASLRRLAWLRWNAHAQGRRQAAIVDGERWIAAAFARRLRPEHDRLVLAQGALPHLHRLGVLGGRRYRVLANALPMAEIERRLDAARRGAGEAAAATLADFRVDAALREAEQLALHGAEAIVTAHAEVARYWRARGVTVQQLSWSMPAVAPRGAVARPGAPLVVFAASALARKGAYELAAALRGLRVRLRVLGSRSADATLWQGIEVEHAGYASDWLEQACVVVLPAHVEHAPRALLRALAAGVPVVATPACGIDATPHLELVPAGDVEALRRAIMDRTVEAH